MLSRWRVVGLGMLSRHKYVGLGLLSRYGLRQDRVCYPAAGVGSGLGMLSRWASLEGSWLVRPSRVWRKKKLIMLLTLMPLRAISRQMKCKNCDGPLNN